MIKKGLKITLRFIILVMLVLVNLFLCLFLYHVIGTQGHSKGVLGCQLPFSKREFFFASQQQKNLTERQ